MSGSSDNSGPIITVKKKRHPQLLKLVPSRAKSCTDFSDRLPCDRIPLLPSSMAAAACELLDYNIFYIYRDLSL